MSWWTAWRNALKVIQPETVLRRRRHGIALILEISITRSLASWAPTIALETRQLIREMALANFLWGAPRVHGKLLKLGITVSQPQYRDTCRRRETISHRRGGPL
jgi:hypothetical protein